MEKNPGAATGEGMGFLDTPERPPPFDREALPDLAYLSNSMDEMKSMLALGLRTTQHHMLEQQKALQATQDMMHRRVSALEDVAASRPAQRRSFRGLKEHRRRQRNGQRPHILREGAGSAAVAPEDGSEHTESDEGLNRSNALRSAGSIRQVEEPQPPKQHANGQAAEQRVTSEQEAELLAAAEAVEKNRKDAEEAQFLSWHCQPLSLRLAVFPPPPPVLTIRGATGKFADLGNINGRFEPLTEGLKGEPAWQRTTPDPFGRFLLLARRADGGWCLGSAEEVKNGETEGFMRQRTSDVAYELPTDVPEWEALVGHGRWELQYDVVVEIASVGSPTEPAAAAAAGVSAAPTTAEGSCASSEAGAAGLGTDGRGPPHELRTRGCRAGRQTKKSVPVAVKREDRFDDHLMTKPQIVKARTEPMKILLSNFMTMTPMSL